MDIPCKTIDPDLWFPVGSTGPALIQQEQAKAHCADCPIIGECLRDALARGDDHGVWGGKSAAERRAILAQNPHLPERLHDEGRSALSRAMSSLP